jgi:hypothetical protein
MPVVETKVKASAAAAAVSGLALWALGRYVFRGSGVPDVVASWVYVITPGLITFAAGYLARHTSVAAPPSVTAPPPPAQQGITRVPPQGAADEKMTGST